MPTDSAASERDPVRERRRLVARWTRRANRAGYVCFAVAIAAFVLGLAAGFSDGFATIIVVALVVGSVLLAPAIVLGYAVKAAEREDVARGV